MWRPAQEEYRQHYLKRCTEEEALRYHKLAGHLAADDVAACNQDLADVFTFAKGMSVLDAGAGTGTLSRMLIKLPDVKLTALEPAASMMALLRQDHELEEVFTVQGFCDSSADEQLFAAADFDVVASRMVINTLYDPLAAFRNWFQWLVPGGAVVLMDGLFSPDAWTRDWRQDVDVLPVSACQSTATVPYLLESAGFHIESVKPMSRTNSRPSTRTPRFLVIARKPA